MKAAYNFVTNVDGFTPQNLVHMCLDYFDQESRGYDDFDAGTTKRRLYCDAIDRLVIERLARLESPCRVVSFGCGTGRREVKIAAALATPAELTGIENAPGMMARAAQRGIRTAPSLDDLDDSPPDRMSAALCLWSFGHLPTVELRLATLRGLFRLLRDDGVLLLDVFNLHDRHEWGTHLLDAGLGERRDVIYGKAGRRATAYVHYFSLGEISVLAERAGFVVETVRAVGYGQHPGRLDVPWDEGSLFLVCRKPRQSTERKALTLY
ncbi:methyltransferase domain-containing protein [Amycolatopsis sp. TRM77291]